MNTIANLDPFLLASILKVVETKYRLKRVTVNANPQFKPPILNEIGIDIKVTNRYRVPNTKRPSWVTFEIQRSIFWSREGQGLQTGKEQDRVKEL